MKKKLISGLAALISLSAVFTACSSDLDVQNPVQQGSRTIRLTSQVQGTRSIDDPQGANLTVNTEVGVFGTDGTTALNSNEKYTVNASNGLDVATTDNAMTWPTDDATSVTVYANAPYQNGWTADGSNAFSVNTDQTSDANYLASDLVWATASKTHSTATDDKIPLSFSHSLTKVNITISKATGSNVNLEGATVYITNTSTSATVNAKTGVATASTGTNQITAATISSDLTAGDANSTTTACAVIIPQTLAANTAFIKIVTTETNGSKTLIAKLGAATTFAANTPYDMSVSVGSVADNSSTEVTLLLGSTEISGWDTSATLGQKTYGVGDYVLNDGTFLKSTDDDFETKKSTIVAKIFSTKVSDIDAAAGFNAYGVGIKVFKNRTWYSVNTGDYQSTQVNSNVTTLDDAIDDLDGRAKTQVLMEKYYPSLTTGDNQTKFVANLINYEVTINSSANNLSKWFLPSFGQIAQIFNQFGQTKLIKGYNDSSNNATAYTYDSNDGKDNPSLEDFVSNLNTAFALGGESQFTNTDVYASSTEKEGAYWTLQMQSSSSNWKIYKQTSRGGNSRIVLPCIAIKNLPIASE